MAWKRAASAMGRRVKFSLRQSARDGARREREREPRVSRVPVDFGAVIEAARHEEFSRMVAFQLRMQQTHAPGNPEWANLPITEEQYCRGMSFVLATEDETDRLAAQIFGIGSLTAEQEAILSETYPPAHGPSRFEASDDDAQAESNDDAEEAGHDAMRRGSTSTSFEHGSGECKDNGSGESTGWTPSSARKPS